MTQENIIKILAGANKVARESGAFINETSGNFVENSLIKGNYVSREEYEQLKTIVLNLQNELNSLKNKK
jgi:BMFP domain-containing protein YqiC